MSGVTYDGAGNMLTLKQRGLKLGKPVNIDSLSYTYFAGSNCRQKVANGIKGPSTLGEFIDSTSTGDDHDYDANGNVTRNNNRHLHTCSGSADLVYNLLDRPDSIVVASKNTVYYTYDATGARLAKKVNDYSSGTLVTQKYLFIGDLVYKNDSLQYLLTEEGRVR